MTGFVIPSRVCGPPHVKTRDGTSPDTPQSSLRDLTFHPPLDWTPPPADCYRRRPAVVLPRTTMASHATTTQEPAVPIPDDGEAPTTVRYRVMAFLCVLSFLT